MSKLKVHVYDGIIWHDTVCGYDTACADNKVDVTDEIELATCKTCLKSIRNETIKYLENAYKYAKRVDIALSAAGMQTIIEQGPVTVTAKRLDGTMSEKRVIG